MEALTKSPSARIPQRIAGPATEVSYGAPLWLLLLVFGLAAVAAGGGLLFPNLYRDSATIRGAWLANDLVTALLILPLLARSVYRARHGNRRAGVFLLGLLVYLFYNYAFYLFGSEFNVFFLAYTGLVASSFYALAIGMLRQDWGWLQARARQLPRVGGVSTFLVFIALPLILVEGGAVADYIINGRLPEVPTVIYALDLSIVVPASLLAAVLLWKRRAWGYLLAALMSIKALTYGLVLVVMTLYLYATGLAEWDTLFPFYLFVTLAGGASVAYLFRQNQKPIS